MRRLFVLAVLCFALPASAAPMFMGLGNLGGTAASEALGVSADGTVVVGHSSSPNDREAFRWTLAGGIEGIGHLDPGFHDSRATSVSGDGSVIVGLSDNGSVQSEAFRWTDSEAMTGLGYPGDCTENAFCSVAWGVSQDGNVAVGFEDVGGSDAVDRRAMAWFADGSRLTIGEGEAYAASADGSVIVGYNHTGSPARWTAATGWVSHPRLARGVAKDVSADGAFAVAWEYQGGSFLWEETGSLTFLGDMEAWAVTADGSTVVGNTGDPSGAVIWNSVNGMRDLQDVLVSDYGLDLTGWTLAQAYDISDNGNVVVGAGLNPEGILEGWIFIVPEPSTFLLLACGLAGLAAAGRRRA